MAQIKDVASTCRNRAEALQGPGYLCLDVRRSPKKSRWIKVSLQGTPAAHSASGLAQMGGPVQANRLGTCCSNGLEPLAATFYKHDHRRGLAIGLALALSNRNTGGMHPIHDGLDVFL